MKTPKKPQKKTKLYPCPCCGSETLSARGVYEICSVCDWEDDPSQSQNPHLRGGANKLSLAEAKERWAARTGA